MKIQLHGWWRRPKDPKKLGVEAVKVAAGVLRFSKGPDVGKITNPIRAGFAQNFADEAGGPHGSPWALLAERTSYERVLLGFDPYHPILERTGSYKRSWIDRTSGDHFERQHKHGQFSGTKLMGKNKVTINLGSMDYRMPTLEGGGDAMPEHLVEREQMLGGMGFGGVVPPRPVRFVSEDHIFMSKLAVAFLLSEKMEDVKGPT